VQADPQTLTARVLDDLRSLLGTKGDPTFRSVQVWPKAIPQYVLGYGRFKEIADDMERRNPGLKLAGIYRDGVSLGDAIASADRAAVRTAEFLGIDALAATAQGRERDISAAEQD
jgi:oxygen-dependent protoporphyrinogen oxidase